MTREAATVPGADDALGSLEAGKRADIVLLAAEDPTLRPQVGDEGLRSNFVYSFHGQADSVIDEGQFVVVDGEVTADGDAAVETGQEFADTAAGDHLERRQDLQPPRPADSSRREKSEDTAKHGGRYEKNRVQRTKRVQRPSGLTVPHTKNSDMMEVTCEDCHHHQTTTLLDDPECEACGSKSLTGIAGYESSDSGPLTYRG